MIIIMILMRCDCESANGRSCCNFVKCQLTRALLKHRAEDANDDDVDDDIHHGDGGNAGNAGDDNDHQSDYDS